MIIVAGALFLDPAARAAYLADCLAVVEAARAAPGCLDFALSADLIDEARINVLERWVSDADLAAFRGSGPSGGQLDQLRDLRVAEYDATERAG